jgi:hypothetical protein
MFLFDLLFVVAIAILLTVIFGSGYRERGAASFIMYFVILALGIWAIGGWIDPFGPTLFGVYFLTFSIAGLFLAILIAAIATPYDQRERAAKEAAYQRAAVENPNQQAAEDDVAVGFSIFFWILIIGLVIAITVNYIY